MVTKISAAFPFVKRQKKRHIAAFLVFFAFGGFAAAQSYGAFAWRGDFSQELRPIFPEAFFSGFIETQRARDAARPYWAPTEAEAGAMAARPLESILLNNYILAYYGHPLSRNMGILGRHTQDELKEMLLDLAAEYRAIGGRNVVIAFYIIYGTVWPGGDIGIIRENVLREWIEFALENNMLIFIDHQIGRFDPIDSLRRMLPYLRYPNVHLALDPEWRTSKPMQEIGSLAAEEINLAQRVMEDYMIENQIPGERILMIHQFHPVMIRGRENVRSDLSKVRLVLSMDGIGPPRLKRESYAFVARAANIPVKGFKLFYNLGIPGAGYDNPLMTPNDVMGLNPRPYVIMYQ